MAVPQSDRELLAWLTDGMPTPAIAAKLGRPVGEVEQRIVDLYRRLGVSNRTDLAAALAKSSAGPERIDAVEAARECLINRFLDDGVIGVDLLHDYGDPLVAQVWLRTQSDADRDSLREHPNLTPVVRAELKAAGIPSDELTVDEVVVQSQQTVDRDCKGDWFYATR